ncbi:H-type lectin domain-containing protein [Roseovarius amoyensis]|uniref:H-type lectin domain-containing protein n=1 Tax=Roseovarius amoyensis TaxID=2211448 RepID=UPI000DBE4046|nr:H-type lectin domain-containing protein [Roseovarius amoyensis]
MKEIPSGLIGIDQGDDVLFSDFEDGGDMWTGDGNRERRRRLSFARSFRDPPAVFVSLSMWDFHHIVNARADVTAENVLPDSFDLVFRTWGDTRVARARVRWMAIGALAGEDDWELY